MSLFDDPYQQGISLSEDQRLAWLRLIRSEQVGPVTFRELINHFGTATEALEALPELARKGGKARRIRIASAGEVEKELALAERFGAKFIGLGEPEYPAWLKTVDGAPPLILAKGQLALLKQPMVAIVGARNCSIIGRKMTIKIARELGSAGYCIASGLARGIDGVAHEAALSSGTVAVLAGGLDRIYPPEHESLAEQVATNGCLVSEMPLGWTPRAQDFPRRNRIVSGLSLGTIVVEAAKKSGSLITAQLALKQNREVFAVPGSPMDPRAAGPNDLIRNGANLVTSGQDVMDALKPIHGDVLQNPPSSSFQEGNSSENRDPTVNDRDIIREALSTTPVEIDELIRHTGLSSGIIYLILLELDLAGQLARHSGNKVSVTDALSL